MRLPPGAPAQNVRLLLDGRLVDQVTVTDGLWRPVRLILPPRPDPRRFVPVVVETAEPDRIVWIGTVSTVALRGGH
jgi:hypothetical protein